MEVVFSSRRAFAFPLFALLGLTGPLGSVLDGKYANWRLDAAIRVGFANQLAGQVASYYSER